MSATIVSDVDKVGRAGALGKRAFLVVVSQNSLGTCLVLEESQAEYRIGRDADADLNIDDAMVSKHHCSVHSKKGDFVISDMGSTNSTYVNNKLLKKPEILSYGDRIIVGSTILRFFYEERIPSK
ncbi:MAG: FHA domain-containing protein [Spirochaetales bacterium]|nr:FHA domain-containing protein [Spirochaetales bacterium]